MRLTVLQQQTETGAEVHGEPLLDVLAGYEREMIEYGFRAVRLSLENMGRVHSEGIRKGLTRLAFRLN